MMAGSPTEAFRLDAETCLLDAESFVLRCLEIVGADLANVPLDFVAAATSRLQAGAGRYDILRDVVALTYPGVGLARQTALTSTASLNADDDFFAEEMLTEFASDDDPAFIVETFNRLCGRQPTAREARIIENDLRRGLTDRRGVVTGLSTRRGNDTGTAPASLLAHRPGVADVRAVERFIGVDGRQVWPILRFHRDLGLIVGHNVHVAAVTADADGWGFRPGLLIRGPRLTLPVGRWRLQFSIRQRAEAVLEFSVISNGGADTHLRVNVEGPGTGSLLFDIQPGQMFTEVIIAKPDQPEHLCRADIRLLQLSPVEP